MLYLREIKDDDLELTMAWRNLTYQNAYYSQKSHINWQEHYAWNKSRKNWKTFIAVFVEDTIERRVGVVTIGQLDHWSPEIGYYVGETTLWGKGVGKGIVTLGLNWLVRNGYKHVHTTVLETNERSLRLLKSLGFEVMGKAREGEVWLMRSIEQPQENST
jgi:RimJ/RimL family protein N-acetyltransferase